MLFSEQAIDNLHFERLLRMQGHQLVAGVDEVGRGPLAGPVVAAAVILPEDIDLPEVTDSKKLSAAKREFLFDEIMNKALAVGVASCTHDTVDKINILQASFLAMKNAVNKLTVFPDALLVDGTFKIPMRLPQKTLIGGDSASLSVAAASIIAKVTRDRLMARYDGKFPGYGFAQHKGYACQSHLKAIRLLGPCAIHRKTFSGVKEHLISCATEQTGSLFEGLQ